MEAYHGGFFAGKAVFSPINGGDIIVDARGSGLATVMNNNAMLFYDALGVVNWNMGANNDGPAAWARVGVRSNDENVLNILDTEMNTVADLALSFFTKRAAGLDVTSEEIHAGLITGDISRAKTIKAMANFASAGDPLESRPHHVDYMRALDPSGEGRNTAAFVFFSENPMNDEAYEAIREQNPDIALEYSLYDLPQTSYYNLPLYLQATMSAGTRDLRGINPVSAGDESLSPPNRTASEVSRVLAGRQSVGDGPRTGRAFKKSVSGNVVFTGGIVSGSGEEVEVTLREGATAPLRGSGYSSPADVPSDTPLNKIDQKFLFDFFVLNSSEDRSDDSRFFRTKLASGNNTVLFEDKETGKKYITKYSPVEA